MKKMGLFLIGIMLMTACVPVSKSKAEIITDCAAINDSFGALLTGYDLPAYFRSENPSKQGGEFDVMQYFNVLDHLSMQPGYVLDYVYHFDGFAGYPVLYTRLEGDLPFATEAELAIAEGNTSFLDFVQVDDTPASYLQYVLLSLQAGQFYLDWHANYDDTQLICDKTRVNSIIAGLDGSFGYRMPLVSRLRAWLLNGVAPTVRLTDLTAEVRIVTFTRWGGFYQNTYVINRTAPYLLQSVDEKLLVPYDCGIMF